MAVCTFCHVQIDPPHQALSCRLLHAQGRVVAEELRAKHPQAKLALECLAANERRWKEKEEYLAGEALKQAIDEFGVGYASHHIWCVGVLPTRVTPRCVSVQDRLEELWRSTVNKWGATAEEALEGIASGRAILAELLARHGGDRRAQDYAATNERRWKEKEEYWRGEALKRDIDSFAVRPFPQRVCIRVHIQRNF